MNHILHDSYVECYLFFLYSSYFLDLHLAAELGKALLETNRELETQSMHLQQANHEQSLEIEVHLALNNPLG